MKKFSTLLFYFLAAHIVHGQPLVTFEKVIPSGLSRPVDVVNAKDETNRLFIVEQTGTVRIWNGNSLLTTPFLDVTNISTVGGERGLLSIAFHPNYKANRYFFIYFNDASGAISVRRYQTKTSDPNQADVSTGVTLLTIPKRFTNHNGGKLAFGADGYLYFATGDGGSGNDPDNNAQNPASLLGKMIRIDVDQNINTPPYYAIPPTNPYAGSTTIKKEIIAIGLRNPWRYSFDRRTGNLWMADVGQDAWEEVNVVPWSERLGANYGWSCFEGKHANPNKASCGAQPNINNAVVPVFEYPRDEATGGVSVTGGLVYRGLEFPLLQGYYLCTDFVTGNGWLINPKSGSTGYNVTLQKWEKQISSFGEAEDSTLYATGLNGILYKVKASTAMPSHIISFAGTVANNFHQLIWNVTNEEDGDVYIIEKRFSENEPFTEAYRMNATGRSSSSYTIKLAASSPETFYRLKTISKNGQIRFSSVIRISNTRAGVFKAFVSGKTLYTNLPADAKSITLFDANGKLLLKQTVTGGNGFFTIPLQSLPKGIIVLKVQLRNELLVKKVVY